MSDRQKRVLVACGTAIATSTVAARLLEDELLRHGLEVSTAVCTAAEAPARAANFDLVAVTTPLPSATTTPVVRIASLLAGLDSAAEIRKVIEVLGSTP